MILGLYPSCRRKTEKKKTVDSQPVAAQPVTTQAAPQAAATQAAPQAATTQAAPQQAAAKPNVGAKPAPAPAPNKEADIMAFLNSWQKAWESRVLDAYMDHYSSKFQNPKGGYAAWKEQKRKFS